LRPILDIVFGQQDLCDRLIQVLEQFVP
jgi:hypothetical protein